MCRDLKGDARVIAAQRTLAESRAGLNMADEQKPSAYWWGRLETDLAAVLEAIEQTRDS